MVQHGSGKGTLAKKISESMNFVNIDTGAMYRSLSLQMIREKVVTEEKEKILEILKKIKIELKDNKVFLNNEDVSKEIRSKEVTDIVSFVSGIKEVRLEMAERQRELAKEKDAVMEGRDIGTVVFPDADVKIYLDANSEERAKRRHKENQEKGIDISYEEVLKNIETRDKNDKEKEFGALKVAEGAIVIDSTSLTFDEVYKKIEEIINEKIEKHRGGSQVCPTKETIKESKKEISKAETVFKEIMRYIIKGILQVFCRILFRIKIVNKNNIPKEGACIICANHVSNWDPLVSVVCTKRPIRMMAKEELFNSKFLSFLGYVFGMFPVKRNAGDMEAIKKSLKLLKAGEILGLYPEGTRKGLEKGIKPKNGAVLISIKSKTPIIPVGLQGEFKPFKKVKINYGKPIYFDQKNVDTQNKEEVDRLTGELMSEIVRLTNEKI